MLLPDSQAWPYFAPGDTNVFAKANGCRETVRSCNFCGGLGIVEVDAANRYRRGRALRNVRVHKLGLTQEQLARRPGISGRELNDIECGRADMPASLERRLLEEL